MNIYYEREDIMFKLLLVTLSVLIFVGSVSVPMSGASACGCYSTNFQDP